MKQRSYHIRGVAPMIHHNARLSDPLDEWTQAIAKITKKTKKTIDDHLEIARLEFMGSLYMGEKGPLVPAQNIERMLRDAAAKSKLGKQVQAGLIVMEDVPVIYDGPKDPAKMWEANRFQKRASCKVGQKRVIRTRPCWTEWEVKFTVNYNEGLLDPEQIDGFVDLGGEICGLADWRPRHGRYEVLEVVA